MNILLVEDNQLIAKSLLYTLQSKGHTVTLCETCASTLLHAGEEFDVILMDVTLPDGSGFELYRDVSRVNTAPVIFLTAMDDEDHIVGGLEMGAADYITKPFSTRELLARIRRFDKKATGQSTVVSVGSIFADTESHTVRSGDKAVELTALEYRILLMLMQNAGKVVTRDRIMEKIWDIAGNYVNDNTLTVYIKRIRQKLDTDLIRTVKGIGYKMEEA